MMTTTRAMTVMVTVTMMMIVKIIMKMMAMTMTKMMTIAISRTSWVSQVQKLIYTEIKLLTRNAFDRPIWKFQP